MREDIKATGMAAKYVKCLRTKSDDAACLPALPVGLKRYRECLLKGEAGQSPQCATPPVPNEVLREMHRVIGGAPKNTVFARGAATGATSRMTRTAPRYCEPGESPGPCTKSIPAKCKCAPRGDPSYRVTGQTAYGSAPGAISKPVTGMTPVSTVEPILELDIQTGQSAEGKAALEQAISDLATFRQDLQNINLDSQPYEVDQRYYETQWTPQYLQDSMPSPTYAPIAATEVSTPAVEEAAVAEVSEETETGPVVMSATTEAGDQGSLMGTLALVAGAGVLLYFVMKSQKKGA